MNWKPKKVIHKKNILELLKKEISTLKEKKSTLLGIGGGINETFSFDEKKNKLSIAAINFLLSCKIKPVIITKNITTLYENRKSFLSYSKENLPIIIYSFSGLKKKDKNILEKDIPKWKTEEIQQLKKEGFPLGIFLSPLIPSINDDFNEVSNIIKTFQALKIDFFLFDFLDVPGLNRIKNHSLTLALTSKQKSFIESLLHSKITYLNHQQNISIAINKLLLEKKISPRIPFSLLRDNMSVKDRIIYVFYYIYFFRNLVEEKKHHDAYYHAAYALEKLSETEWEEKLYHKKLTEIKGIGEVTSKNIYMMALKNNYSLLENVEKEKEMRIGSGPTWI